VKDILISSIKKIIIIPLFRDVFQDSTNQLEHPFWTNIVKNYRSSLNLTFLSKVIVRSVAFHLNKYLFNNKLKHESQDIPLITTLKQTCFDLKK